MELQDLDLNLLVVFNQLLVERRVSRVADNLGISQPAVSNSLAKLRKLFGDELFLRTAKGMEPTPYADQLAESVSYALAMIHSGINQRSSFDPASARQAVTIGMTDIGEIYFLPALIERMGREAPAMTLSTVRNTAINLKDELEAGKVDLAIGLLPQLKAGFFQRRLFTQSYVCVMRRGHRLDKRRISLPEFTGAEHLVVVSAGTGHGKVDELLQRSGVERTIRLTVPHYVGVGHILHNSDLIATIPERLADRLIEPFDLVTVPHPAKLPDVAINVFWHAKYHRSPANQWLRGVVFDLFGDKAGSTRKVAG
ncbi:LysR family transcriptional regulator [Cupriavidus basilensis]|uniref:LysR family transcriptional regulator n=1 Tax=Cupriavidus basilensis TaxID=68895 RepID=A0ABT6AKU6_9BURK|nr:LysR family transcriptional regulator [Cupriavidus basilensis]MDF3833206.1 LysR family transcriptional regulator [Cupriavidus basilensis]